VLGDVFFLSPVAKACAGLALPIASVLMSQILKVSSPVGLPPSIAVRCALWPIHLIKPILEKAILHSETAQI
jgi:hypothetical protein